MMMVNQEVCRNRYTCPIYGRPIQGIHPSTSNLQNVLVSRKNLPFNLIHLQSKNHVSKHYGIIVCNYVSIIFTFPTIFNVQYTSIASTFNTFQGGVIPKDIQVFKHVGFYLYNLSKVKFAVPVVNGNTQYQCFTKHEHAACLALCLASCLASCISCMLTVSQEILTSIQSIKIYIISNSNFCFEPPKPALKEFFLS